MRGALLLLDYEEEATGPFRQLLLQCFLKPTYLRSADGRRLLTYLFGLHPALVADIHETVKSQLPYAKNKLVQAYGDVYFRAWKSASSPYLEAIETGCIQDLMHAAVHSSSPSLYVTLRLFLQAFHTNKRLREVDAMLLRLYNPILWRSLQVASPTVRAQATGLLVDAFPLQNPDMGTIEAASLLQKQLDMLQALLLDPEPHVRVAAVVGVCRVLSVFWEAIPLHVTKQYITRLVGSLAFDSSSALVRLAVVEGLTELLEQPLAHPVLKQALPLTAPLLQDKTPRVRSAFVGLLQKVKAVRDIKFYQVVPVEHLLARFAMDAPKASSKALSARMADLLLNSYFPQMDSPSLPSSSSSDFEQVGPLSPPARRPRTTTTSSNRDQQEKEAKATFAQELIAASMMVALAELKATVGGVAAAATASSVEEGMESKVNTKEEEAQVALRAQLLSVLFESAAEKARKTLLPKVARSLDATLEGAKEAAPASERVVQMANTIEALGEKLQRLAVESS
eukprot:evm.model.NODE_17594_length_8172_cov_15.400881.2